MEREKRVEDVEMKTLESINERKRKASELEQFKAETERMKIVDEREARRTQQELQQQEHQRLQRKVTLDEQKLAAQMEVSAQTREANERAVATLAQPRKDMLTYARGVNARDADSAILGTLEAKGFSFFTDPAHFETSLDNVEAATQSALQNLPKEMKVAVIRSLSVCSSTSFLKQLFTFENGQGTFAKVMVRCAETNGRKSIAVLPYGMSFECSKVVESYKTVETPVPIFDEEIVSVPSSTNWFRTTYTTHKRRRLDHTAIVREQVPVFKQDVLSVEKLNQVMEALEIVASKKALEGMS